MIRRFLVSGRVQGVGFRWFVRRAATGLGLDGLVRNLDDGRVEAVARGEEADLVRLAEQLARGPRDAHVTDVEISEILGEVDVGSGFNIIG